MYFFRAVKGKKKGLFLHPTANLPYKTNLGRKKIKFYLLCSSELSATYIFSCY